MQSRPVWIWAHWWLEPWNLWGGDFWVPNCAHQKISEMVQTVERQHQGGEEPERSAQQPHPILQQKHIERPFTVIYTHASLTYEAPVCLCCQWSVMWEKEYLMNTGLWSGWQPAEHSSSCRWTMGITTRFWRLIMTTTWSRIYALVSLVHLKDQSVGWNQLLDAEI